MEIIYKITDTISKVDADELNLLKALTELEETRKYLEECLIYIKDFKYKYIEEIELSAKEHQGKYGGYGIEVRSGGKMYNFKEIPEWIKLDNEKKLCEKKYKLILESALKGMTSVDDNGEILPMPNVTYRKSSVVLKKLR